ncbi:MAG TPA: hypothetical protein VK762_35115 [Polyangiaceae bacterium]|nr:hypothetical protein [Polyangiaceae bacterium]
MACTHDASTTRPMGDGDDGSDASSTAPDGTSAGADGSPAGSDDATGSVGLDGSRLMPEAGAVVCTAGGVSGAPGPGETTFEAIPTLPTQSPGVAGSACGASLGAAWGTNFPYPADPYAPATDGGPTVKNQSVLGWEGNVYAPFAYLSGSFFARGVVGTYAQGGNSYCGTMFSFGVYGAYAHPAGSVQWTMDDGHLPALTTAFTSGSIAVSITNFADRVTVGGHAFELVYSRVAVTNNGTSTVTVDPRPPTGLAALGAVSSDVPAGGTNHHDYVVAVDDFGAGLALPASPMLASVAPAYDAAYQEMKTYWDGRLSVIPVLELPDVALPNTGGLSHPGSAMTDAFKAAFVYTRIVQSAAAPFSAANNYDNLLNHDAPEILANRFTLGDFQDGPNLLLAARASEATNYPEYGANWYWDGVWKTPWPWAIYLAKTGDVAFVGKYFHDDSGVASGWGPSLYTMMHEIPGQLTGAGYLGTSNDNDSMGQWLFDDYSAFIGLAAYKYIATVLGNATEAKWADGQLTSLMSATNAALSSNQRANGFSYLPCEVNVPTGADRCATPSDANWASPAFYGQNAWDTFLMGGNPTGIVGDPAQVDALYTWGFGRLNGSLPYPTMGGYNATSYSTADNTGYAEGALFGSQYRDLPITSYAWQIAMTTGGPNAWWEATKAPPDKTDAWAGNHAPVEFGACPYAWPLAGQTLALVRSIVAEGLAATSSNGSFAFTRPAYVGRGIPDAWIAAGQTIAVSNLTSSYTASANGSCERSTYGVSIATSKSAAQREVTFSLSGAWPGKTVLLQLPSFKTAGVSNVQGGTYDSTANTVTVTPAPSGTSTVVVTLGT